MSLDLGQAVKDAMREVVREEIRAALREVNFGGGGARSCGDEELITYEDAAELAACSTSTIGNWVRRAMLPAFNKGRLRRVRASDVRRVLEGGGPTNKKDLQDSPQARAEAMLANLSRSK